MGNNISSGVSADVEYKEDTERFSMISWSIKDSINNGPAPLVSLQTMCKDVANTEGYVLNEKLLREAFPPETWFIKKTIELVWKCKDSLINSSNTSLEGWLFLDDGQNVNHEHFESCHVGQDFPRSSLRDRVCRIFDLGSFDTHDKEMHTVYPAYIPSILGRRIVYFYIIDDSKHLLLKAKAIVVSNDEFHPNESAIPSMDERQVREKGFETKTANKVRNTLLDVQHPDENIRATQYETTKELDKVYHGPRNLLTLFHEPVVRAEFQAFQKVERAKIQHCIANDFTNLAYRVYSPDDGKYNHVVLYIAQNTYFTDVFAYRMSKAFPISVYIAEIRGYGYSGGPRGHTKSTELVFDDIRTFVRMVRYSHHDPIHIILAGYLHTASLILKYDGYEHKEPVSGYLFYAPNFGLNCRDTFREDTFFSEALKQNIVKRHSSNIFLSKATHGAIKGDKPAVDMKFPDEVYALTPMTVSRVTTNMMIATAVTDLKSQFQELKLPFCFLVGENDEMFLPDVLVKYAKMAKSTTKYIRITPGLANMNIQSGTVDMVGNWILNTFDLDANLPSAGKLSGRSSITTSSKSNASEASRDMDDIMNTTKSMERDLPQVRYMESYDGTMLAYQIFEPKSHPIAVMMLWMEYYTSSILPELADATNTIIYRLDVRGTGKSDGEYGTIKSKSQLWNDIKLIILFAKQNYPQHVIFAGGHSFGASMLLNYASKWDEAIHPNAYVFLSPVAHPFSGKNAPLLEDNVDQIFSKTGKKSFWKRSKSITWNINPDYRMSMNQKFASGVFCKNILEQILVVDIPFGIWLGSEDEFCKVEPIVDAVCALSKAPMHASECIKSQTHFGVLKQLSKQQSFVSWINRVAVSLNPRPIKAITDCKINDLEKIELIGKGTFGRVWLVFHKKLEKYLALKILKKADVLRHKLVHQVLRERHLLETTSNPFIVPFVGAFQNEHNLYLLMEFLVGGELYTLIRLYNTLPITWVRFFAAELLIAINYLHEHGIVYRDLKPENILLDALGHIRLIDFGLARTVEPSVPCSTFCGSPFYMAPEMVSSRSYSFSVDIWALGIVIYELLTGSPPFTGNTQVEIYRKVLFGKIPWPHNMDPDAKDLIQKLLQQDPNKRLGCSIKSDASRNNTRLDEIQETKRSITSLMKFSTGYNQIMRHKFFKGIDWDQIRLRQMSPPFQPAVKSDDDTGNFLKYNTRDSKSDLYSVDYGDIFKDF